MDEIKIGSKVMVQVFDKQRLGEVEDIYTSEIGRPSLYKLKNSDALFNANEITLYKDGAS
ncbi:hypothetical protein [Metasolibacillus meyeri]|uniref:hypothetical protein n=1 Tax=Metasolibacillus meyeri TaxID=1071052 RepID=UPI000D325E01|nr:hypothetical protein [Metasolibacillus meyeri]